MIQQNILNLLNSDDLNNGLLGWQMLELFHPEIAMAIYMRFEKYLSCMNRYKIDEWALRAISIAKCWRTACPLICRITVNYCELTMRQEVEPAEDYFKIDGIAVFFANKA